MITDDQFISLSSQKLMGSSNFDDYFFSYFKNGLISLLTKLYTQDGTFGSTRINIESVANDTFRLDSNREGVTTDGHLLANDDVDVNYAFQNISGQTYYVGMFYGETPVDIKFNSITGLPEYTNFEESIGLVAEPDDVIDNGGTITFQVDSVTESGVTNAGRSVRVWKKIPGEGASTIAIAMEIATVSWSGTANVITTTGTLGQSSVSTTESDYYVQLVGPNVNRNTDLRNEDCWFIGIITGNGPTAIPSSFDMSDQLRIVYSLSTLLGASYYTVDDSNFHGSPADDSTSGGIGSSIANVQAALEGIDSALVMRRTAITMADDGDRDLADYVGADAVDEINTIGNGGYYFLQRASSGFTALGDIGDTAEDPEVVGEIATGGHDGYANIDLSASATAHRKLQGLFRRLYFSSSHASYKWGIGKDGSRGETIIEQCGFEAGTVFFGGFNANTRPIIIRDVEIASGSNAGDTASLDLDESLGDYPYIIFQNCVIRGPNASISSPVAIIRIRGFGNNVRERNQAYSRRIIFQDCQIIHENITTIPTIYLYDNCTQIVEFNRCKIIGITGQTEPVVQTEYTASYYNYLIMRDCIIEAPSGQALRLEKVEGYLENITVYSGTDTTVTDPQLIGIYSEDNTAGFHIKNLKVFVGASAVRNGTTPTKPVINIGNVDNTLTSKGRITVDGLYVKFLSTIHDHNILTLIGADSTNNKLSEFRNISIDLSSATYGIGSQQQTNKIRISGTTTSKTIIENLNIFGLSEPQSSNDSYYLIYFNRCNAKDINIHKSSGDGTFGWMYIIFMANSFLKKFKVYSTDSYIFRTTNYFLYASSNNILEDINLEELYLTAASYYIYLYNANNCFIKNVLFPNEDAYNSNIGGFLLSSMENTIIMGCKFLFGSNSISFYPLQCGSNCNNIIIKGNTMIGAASTYPYIFAVSPTTKIMATNNILESTNTTTPDIDLQGTDNLETDNIIVNA